MIYISYTIKADFHVRDKQDGRPQGIDYVIVNGEVVVENGELKRDVLPEKIIK